MNEKRQEPAYGRLIIGTIVGLIVTICIAVFLASGAAVNVVMSTILFVPDQLGLVWKITAENTLTFERSGVFRLPEFPAGDYLVYYEGVVPLPDLFFEAEHESSFVELVPFPIVFDPFDRPGFGPGPVDEPLYYLSTDTTEDLLLHLSLYTPGSLRIVPNFSTHNDWVFVLSILVQGAILVLIATVVYRLKNRDRLAAEKVRRAEGREKFDDWFGKFRDERDR